MDWGLVSVRQNLKEAKRTFQKFPSQECSVKAHLAIIKKKF